MNFWCGQNFRMNFFGGPEKNELSEWKNEKKTTKKIFFFIFIFFVFFHFFHSANQVWHESPFQKLAQNESSFFHPRKFWSAGRFTLFDSLLFIFFWQFWKIRNRFLNYSFVFNFLDFKSSFFSILKVHFFKLFFFFFFWTSFWKLLGMPLGISKTGTLELSYFQNWYSRLVFQKELFHKPETFEKQRQPRVPVLKIRKFQSTSF